MGLKVPPLGPQAQYASIRARVPAPVTRVCDTRQFIIGPVQVVGLRAGMDPLMAVAADAEVP